MKSILILIITILSIQAYSFEVHDMSQSEAKIHTSCIVSAESFAINTVATKISENAELQSDGWFEKVLTASVSNIKNLDTFCYELIKAARK